MPVVLPNTPPSIGMNSHSRFLPPLKSKDNQFAPFLCEAAHPIKHSVNKSPIHIAAQRTNKHRADALATCFRHTERAGESKDHDQTEEDFGDTINRIQHALGGPFEGAFRHGALGVEA